MEHLLLFSYLGHVSYKLSLLTQDLVTLFSNEHDIFLPSEQL